jgi:hypothetical protein
MRKSWLWLYLLGGVGLYVWLTRKVQAAVYPAGIKPVDPNAEVWPE